MNRNPIILAALALLFLANTAGAQFINDINGRPIHVTAYTEVEGSPYLADHWSPATVKMSDNKLYKDLELKYDQLQDEPLFKNKAGEALYFVDPVKEFTLLSIGNAAAVSHFRNGYPAVENNTSSSFYQVIADGKVQLLKKIKKSITESKEYNSATVVKKITPVTSYYIFTEGKLVKVRKDKKSIYTALGNQNVEKLDQFIKDGALNLKNDEDASRLLTYHNSLIQ